MINCIFATPLNSSVTECRNYAKSHLHRAAEAFCFRCKHRVAIDDDIPATVEKLPEERQMRIEEWLGEW